MYTERYRDHSGEDQNGEEESGGLGLTWKEADATALDGLCGDTDTGWIKINVMC